MRRRTEVRQLSRKAFCLMTPACMAICTLMSSAYLSTPAHAQEQSEETRVMWQLRYDPGLSASQRAEVQNTLLSTLSRVKERHFASPSIVTNKIKNEGLQMPSCFENGGPCPSGPAFLLDVHQVDVYVDALFSKSGDIWRVELKLFRRLSSSTNVITQSGKTLSSLINNVVGSLFVLESSIDITSKIPDVEVYLNQKLIGTTPLAMKITEGDQKLTFKKEGYFPSTWEFTAKKGAIHSHDVELKPETTQFTVLASDPDAKIFIDSVEVGKTGDMREVLPGEHNIKVTSDFYHDYEQSITVYPGHPQTMQVSMLPYSRDPYEVRHDGIGRYRFSATAGYHFAFTKFSMEAESVRIHKTNGNHEESIFVSPGSRQGNQTTRWANTSLHGMTFALNYENEYWGVTIARLDLMGSPISTEFGLYTQGLDGRPEKSYKARADGATFIGFYPAQIKGHYTFWVMQAEAVAGIGLSWLQLRGDLISDVENRDTDYNDSHVVFSRTQFSANFDFALKYFFSEESFAMVSYGFQIDAEKHNSATFRHGMTFAVGLQIPLLMRDKALQRSLDEGIMLDDEAVLVEEPALAPKTRVVDDAVPDAPAPEVVETTSVSGDSDAPAPVVDDSDATVPVIDDSDAPAPVVDDDDVVPVSALNPVQEVFHV